MNIERHQNDMEKSVKHLSEDLKTENSLLELFFKWETAIPDNIFLRQPIGSTWKNYTWRQAGKDMRCIAGALKNQGLKKGDHIAILSANCAEWIICDLAIMFGGFVSIPLYSNVNAETMKVILNHSGSRFMFIGKLLPKDWNALRDSIPISLEAVTMKGYEKDGIHSWGNFINSSVETEMASPSPDDVLTIIYTSGTTGTPKGVVHTNKSIINAVRVASDEVMLNRKGNRFISYLPLSHAAERGLIEAGAIYCGGTISFVESLDSFMKNLQDTAPTHFFGVPRIWEKIRSQIQKKLPEKRLDLLLRLPIVSNFIKNKIKKSLGLNKAIVILSGAAPVSPELIIWYQKLGIPIREAYGLTEDFNVLSINPRDDIRGGTAGKLFPNQHIIIDHETQEIKQKCDWLMAGYYDDPDLTSQTIVNGYLQTGDMGRISEDGFLTITGRVKDIFKTSKGEYITPRPIESKFLTLDVVDQACVMGSRFSQPFIAIVLSEKGKNTQKVKVESQLNSILNNYNEYVMDYQKLKKAIIVKEEWTNDNCLLTPTLKMKRNALSDKYESALEMIYHNESSVCWEQNYQVHYVTEKVSSSH
jgi:long-chain acyl-CoA synthetase